MSEEALERYRQRYENWRHLDRLRYVVIEVTLGALVASAAIIEALKAGLPMWSWLAISIFLFLQSKVLAKIDDGIVANGEALKRYADEVGDTLVPSTLERRNSIFYYIEWILLALSALTFLFWILKFLGKLAA